MALSDTGIEYPPPAFVVTLVPGIDTVMPPRPSDVNWPLAGDNLFIDMNLSPENLLPGQRLAIGSAEIEITALPHTGCDQFVARYGREACVFVNTGAGKANRLRGIYARVVRDGRIAVGDRVRKLG